MALVEVSDDYGYVLAVAIVLAFQVIIQGFSVGGMRRKLFTSEFIKKVLEKEGSHAEPSKFRGGYPDAGSGRFSNSLSFDDWAKFNNVQRAHLNYVEGIASILLFELVSGMFFPRFSAAAGALYFVGRALYGLGYSRKGPGARIVGALLLDLALVALFLAALYGSLTVANAVPSFVTANLPQCMRLH